MHVRLCRSLRSLSTWPFRIHRWTQPKCSLNYTWPWRSARVWPSHLDFSMSWKIFYRETPSSNVSLLISLVTLPLCLAMCSLRSTINDFPCSGDQICSSLILPGHAIHLPLALWVSIFVVALVLCCGAQILHHLHRLITILCAVEFLGRYLDSLGISDLLDFVTVYFVVWQLISVLWNWMWHNHPSPILLIEQAATCIFMSSVAFVGRHCAFRYVPREASLVFHWILSVTDMYVWRSWRLASRTRILSFFCLHPRAWLRIPSSRKAR